MEAFLTQRTITRFQYFSTRKFITIIFFVFSFHSTFSQVTIIGGSAAEGTYPKLKVAVDSLNNKGLYGPVTIHINANFVDTLSDKIILKTTGSQNNPITIQKIGSGNNPKLISYIGSITVPSSLADGFFVLAGCDYITIDGIDLEERSTNSTPTTVMEFGYGLFKKDATNGCQHNTIKNCSIKLNRIQSTAWTGLGYNGSAGIVITNGLFDSSVSNIPTHINGSNSFNEIYHNTVRECFVGILLNGYNPNNGLFSYHEGGLGDTDNMVGGLSQPLGNTIINFGGTGSQSTAGIFANNQWNLICSYNTINNNDGFGNNHQTTLRGIYMQNANKGSATCKNNHIILTNESNTSPLIAIESGFGNNGVNNTIDLSNNNISLKYPTSTTANIIGIYHNFSSAKNLKIKNNYFKSNSQSTAGEINSIRVTGNISNQMEIDSNLIDSIAIKSSASSVAIKGINIQGGATTCSTYIRGNVCNVISFTASIGGSGDISFIHHIGNPIHSNIKFNIFQNQSLKTTGNIFYTYNSYNMPTTGSKTFENNTFKNITRNGSGNNAMYGYYDIEIAPTNSNFSISNNLFENINNGAATGYLYGFQIGSTASSPTINLNNNVIHNYICNNNLIGINIIGLGGTTQSPSQIQYNSVSKLESFSGSFVTGILVNNTNSNTNILDNTVDSIITSSITDLYGIYYLGGIGEIQISKNKVNNIFNKGTSSTCTANGIGINGGNHITIHNNLIGNINTPNSSSLIAVNGMRINAGFNVNLFYNTIALNATSNNASFGSSALFVNTNITSILSKNNIYINTSIPGSTSGYSAALRFLSNIGLINYHISSNTNLFYAGSPSANKVLYGEGINSSPSNGKLNLPDLKHYFSSGADSNSITENVNFLSAQGSNANFLHINNSIPTEIEGSAMPINGITIDFDNNSRHSLKPDIGADEGNYLFVDHTPPYISFDPLTSACDSLKRELIVNISDVGSGVPTSGIGMPKLYWKISSMGSFSQDTAEYLSGNKYKFVFGEGPVKKGDTVFYYIIAQDLSANPNVTTFPPIGANGYTSNPPNVNTPPTTLSFYKRTIVLNGTYSVNHSLPTEGNNFNSLTHVISAIQNYCINGNLVFELKDTLYSPYATNEVFPLNLSQNPNQNLTQTITIKPAVGVNSKIEGKVSNSGLFNFNGTKNIFIDGSNNNSNSRNLIIKNDTTINPTVLNIFNDVKRISFKNINIQTPISSVGSTGLSAFGEGLKNISFQNLKISNTENAIRISGSSNHMVDSLNIISNEIISSSNGIKAINLSFVNIGNIDQNLINIESFGPSIPIGIAIENGCKNVNITKNKITKVKNSSSIASGARGITIATSTANSNIKLINNFIAGIESKNDTSVANSSIGIGIGIQNNESNIFTEGIKLYNNSINLSSKFATNASCKTAALLIGNNAFKLDIRNNLFSNTMQDTFASSIAESSKAYAIYSKALNLSFDSINYNNYWVDINQGILGSINGINQNSLSNLKSAFGQNGYSSNFKPTFASTTDLHLLTNQNYLLDNTGTYIADVNNDIDNTSRNLATPDIGADEFTTPPCSMAGGGSFNPSLDSLCYGNTKTLEPTGISLGPDISLQWQYATNSGNGFMNIVVEGNSYKYTTPVLNIGNYYYRLRVICLTTSDTSYSNEFILKVNPNPNISISSSSNKYCLGTDSITLLANGGVNYLWSPSTGLSNNSSPINHAAPLLTQNYMVTGINEHGCSSTANAQIDVVLKPQIEILSAALNPICFDSSTMLTSHVSQNYDINNITYLLKDTTGFINGPYGDDEISNEIILPFSFSFYNKSYNKIFINTNGQIGFDSAFTNLGNLELATPSLLPNNIKPNNTISLCWADLLASSGNIKYGVIGNTPNRVFVVDFRGLVFKTGGQTMSGQIQLYEGTDKIQIHLKETLNNSAVKVVGTENINGNLASMPLNRHTQLLWSTSMPEAYEFFQPSIIYNWSPTPNFNNATIPNPIAHTTNNTNKFYLNATSNSCSNIDSIELEIITSPTINSDPSELIVCQGAYAIFTSDISGANLSYQWKKDGTALTNNTTYSGVNSEALYINNVSENEIGFYSLEAMCCGTTIESKSAELIVNPLPVVSISPKDTLCVSTAQEIQSSSDIGDLYLWKNYGQTINNATDTSYLAANPGRYYLVVTDSRTGCVDSSNALLLTFNTNLPPLSFDPNTLNLCVNQILPISAKCGYDQIENYLKNSGVSNNLITPYKNAVGGHKMQFIITPTELSNLNTKMKVGSEITSIGFKILSGNSAALTNFTLKASWINATSLTNQFRSDASQIIFQQTNYIPSIINGEVVYQLATPLLWDGFSSLLIETCFNNNNGGNGSSLAIEAYNTTNQCIYYSANNNANVCSTTATPSITTASPNIKIGHRFNSTKTWSPFSNLYLDGNAMNVYSGEIRDTLYVKNIVPSSYTTTATTKLGCVIVGIVNTTITDTDTVYTENDYGQYSLRKILECINNHDTIYFANGINEISFSDSLKINKDVSIIDNGDVNLYFDFDNISTLSHYGLKIDNAKNVLLENLSIKHKNNSITKPIILNNGNTTLKNVTIKGNTLPVVLNKSTGNISSVGVVHIKSGN